MKTSNLILILLTFMMILSACNEEQMEDLGDSFTLYGDAFEQSSWSSADTSYMKHYEYRFFKVIYKPNNHDHRFNQLDTSEWAYIYLHENTFEFTYKFTIPDTTYYKEETGNYRIEEVTSGGMYPEGISGVFVLEPDNDDPYEVEFNYERITWTSGSLFMKKLTLSFEDLEFYLQQQ
jgi:hypothetical protein